MILIFRKNIILNFYAAIPLDTELKMNVYKTNVRSFYVLVPGDVMKLQILCYWANLIKQ